MFVIRRELVAPATERAVERELVTDDSEALKMFGRFLEPFLESSIQKESNPVTVPQFHQALNSDYNSEIAKNRRRD